jgi:predicted N-acetyltransferase YhbS
VRRAAFIGSWRLRDRNGLAIRHAHGITSTVLIPAERSQVANAVKEAPWQIRHEEPDDVLLVDALNAASFGPGRHVKSAYRLREGVDPVAALSFVAVENGVFRASVRFWPVCVGSEKALLLGPLAVQSDQRGRGIGIALMKHGIEEARKTDFTAIILVGDEPYYSRVGFTRLPPGRLRFPGPVDPARILGVSIATDGLLSLEGDVKRYRV